MNENKIEENVNKDVQEDSKEEHITDHTKDQKLEDVLAQVEYCIAQLDDPQISLEDSFRYYEEGIRNLKICTAKVEQIEKKMLVMNQQGELEDFNR